MMPSIKCLVVDDEAPARRRLIELLGDCASEVPHSIVAEAAQGFEALACVEEYAPDLVFLDMQMPRMSGLEVARHLASLPKPPACVFVTAHDEYAVQAFEVNALDYLMKPVRTERLLAALKKAVAQRDAAKSNPFADGHALAETLARLPGAARKHFAIAERGRLSLVPISEVLYLRAELKYVTVRTAAKEYLLEESLVTLEEEFTDIFVRVHRNALIAKRAIKGFEKGHDPSEDGDGDAVTWQVILEGIPDRLAVSRRQWAVVKAMVKT